MHPLIAHMPQQLIKAHDIFPVIDIKCHRAVDNQIMYQFLTGAFR